MADWNQSGQTSKPRARWFLPVVIMLALVSLFWFGEGVWVAINGSLGEAYFPAFMGLLFAVAVYINYRTYMTRVAPFNRRQSSGTDNSLHGLPTFGTYQPGGPPRSSGNRWMNWARYSFRLRLLGIFVFGGMILLYNTGGHYLGAWTKTNGTQVAPEAQLPPVTRTPAGDVSIQSDLISAAATARAVYVANHGTFDGLSSAAMNSQPGNHLLFTIVQSPRGSQKAISFSGIRYGDVTCRVGKRQRRHMLVCFRQHASERRRPAGWHPVCWGKESYLRSRCWLRPKCGLGR